MQTGSTIHVKFFASLRERLGTGSIEVAAATPLTAAELWARVGTGASLSDDGVLVAVNHDYVDAGHAVRGGDEVAFFPPVTGG